MLPDAGSQLPVVYLVNGVENPQLQIAPGEMQLWRFANIGANVMYKLTGTYLAF